MSLPVEKARANLRARSRQPPDFPVTGSRWQHYQGEVVAVLGHGFTETDGIPCVVYEGDSGIPWIVELSVWNGRFTVEGNLTGPRFVRIEE